MPGDTLTVALVTEVFPRDEDAAGRLRQRLEEARTRGAELAVLPELPLNHWSPATQTPRAEDAEPPGGPRSRRLAEAAAAAGIGVLGGAIVTDAAAGERRNTALLFDADGSLIATYAKLHLPQEPGFWETSHYEAGRHPPAVVQLSGAALPLGMQICSDINRPGAAALAASGAEAILVPRATEAATYERWRLVFRATALTTSAYVLSVNRPVTDPPPDEAPIGGPSIAVGPDGSILEESTDPLAVVTLDREAVHRARRAYPGYLPVRADLYAEAWAAVPPRPAR